MNEKEPSEFGAGVVVCLAKFSEHLGNSMIERFLHARHWHTMKDDQRAKTEDEACQHPFGDASRLLGDVRSILWSEQPQRDLMRALSLWANGASDHFYELDRERAPAPLVELAELMLDLGHGKGLMGGYDDGDPDETWKRIKDLWHESCLAVDKQLGTQPDWGQW